MITLQELTWSNAFSYAENNSIKLDENPLTQLVGKNGSGKTSIPLILQEVLYGKNVKNVKKQDIVNRHTDNKGYSITLVFKKDNNIYEVSLDRKTSIKLSFFENGVDISSHTSINTYKQIASKLGIEDFKIFTQLIYQSSTGSLEFLTATDTNRKKFLISLLQLERYVRIYDMFKEQTKNKSLKVSNLEGKIESNKKWIDKHKDTDFTERNLKKLPKDISDYVTDELAEIKAKLANIKQINAKIRDNNQYERELANIDISIVMEEIPSVNIQEYNNTVKQFNSKKAEKLEPINLLNKMKALDNKCPTCLQDIDDKYVSKLTKEAKQKIEKLDAEIESLQIKRKELDTINSKVETQKELTKKFEELNRSYDPTLDKDIINNVDLEKASRVLQTKLSNNKKEIEEINNFNAEVTNYNSKLKVIMEQLEDFKEEVNKLEVEYAEVKSEYDTLEILKKVFSTNGLVSYKIESSVKELEKTINSYLSEFSHFQVYFKLEKDKLNIRVMDDTGKDTSIENLSAGELGRVNIATVLAIRNIMSSLTSTKINFLFLDEIVGVLDAEGREKLTEILLKEGLNTFMVSHEYEHPLVPKLYINKKDNISRIDNAG